MGDRRGDNLLILGGELAPNPIWQQQTCQALASRGTTGQALPSNHTEIGDFLLQNFCLFAQSGCRCSRLFHQ